MVGGGGGGGGKDLQNRHANSIPPENAKQHSNKLSKKTSGMRIRKKKSSLNCPKVSNSYFHKLLTTMAKQNKTRKPLYYISSVVLAIGSPSNYFHVACGRSCPH